jgi:opacity protein-like surface antigen
MNIVSRRFKYAAYAVLTLLCLTNRIAWADAFDITPFVGTRAGGELDNIDSNNQSVDLDVEDGDLSYGVIFAIPVFQELRIEFLYSHQETQLEADSGFLTPSSKFSDIDIDYYHVGASWEWVLPKIRPFFAMGIGATRFDPDEQLLDDDTRFSYSLGGGVKLFVQKNIALHLGGRFFSTYIDNQKHLHCNNNNTFCFESREDEYLNQFEAMLGLTFRF